LFSSYSFCFKNKESFLNNAPSIWSVEKYKLIVSIAWFGHGILDLTKFPVWGILFWYFFYLYAWQARIIFYSEFKNISFSCMPPGIDDEFSY